SDVCSSDLWDRAAVERRRRRGRRAPARRRAGTNRTRQNGPPSRPEAPQEAPRPRTENPGTSSCRSSWRPPCRVTVVASRIDEVGPEQVASSVKSGHDGTDGPVDDRGDGAVRQPLDVSQLHDFPHEGRQAADTFPDPFDGLLAKENVLGSERNREEGTLEQPGRLRVVQRISRDDVFRRRCRSIWVFRMMANTQALNGRSRTNVSKPLKALSRLSRSKSSSPSGGRARSIA